MVTDVAPSLLTHTKYDNTTIHLATKNDYHTVVKLILSKSIFRMKTQSVHHTMQPELQSEVHFLNSIFQVKKNSTNRKQ